MLLAQSLEEDKQTDITYCLLRRIRSCPTTSRMQLDPQVRHRRNLCNGALARGNQGDSFNRSNELVKPVADDSSSRSQSTHPNPFGPPPFLAVVNGECGHANLAFWCLPD